MLELCEERNNQWALTDRKGKKICNLKIAQKSCNSHFLKKKDIFPIKDELFLYIGCKDVAGSFK